MNLQQTLRLFKATLFFAILFSNLHTAASPLSCKNLPKTSTVLLPHQTSKPSFFGYENIICLENTTTIVIITPDNGGKIMYYGLKKKNNALVLAQEENGWDINRDDAKIINSGARFDFGPPGIHSNRVKQNRGKWHVNHQKRRTATLTSSIHEASKLQFKRKFSLKKNDSTLKIEHTMINTGKNATSAYFWGRAFFKGHGIAVIPLTPPSMYSNHYIQSKQGKIFMRPPQDSAVAIENNLLIVSDSPKIPKFGIDTFAGWYAYLMQDDVMMIGSYETHPEKNYADLNGGIFSLYYNLNYKGHSVAELEPISPKYILASSEKASFRESWKLIHYPFPKHRKLINSQKIRQDITPHIPKF